MKKRNFNILILILLAGGLTFSCSGKKEPANLRKTPPKKRLTFEEAKKDWRNNKGVGPIKSVELGPINDEMVSKGSEVFEINCTACHLPYSEKIGPALLGITERRTPEWIMNMILNPVEMTKTDPICVGLLAQYNYTEMADQSLKKAEARAILEYFRTLKLDTQTDPG